MKPVISIVIPTFNRAFDLKRAIGSVVAQTYQYWEILVVDNHSTDNTCKIVNDFNDSRISLIKIHNDGVIAKSRNLGVKYSQGEYIAFLDSDDWWLPLKLEVSLDYLEKGNDLVYHSLYIVNKRSQKIFWKKIQCRSVKKPVFDDLILIGNAISNSSVVVRKSILNNIGGLSEEHEFIAIEDFDAWLRVSKVTDKFKLIPKILGYYWNGGGNVTNSERTLMCLNAFSKRYSNEMEKINHNSVIWWFNYSKGRAHYLLGEFKEANNSFRKIDLTHLPIILMAKIIWMMLIIKI